MFGDDGRQLANMQAVVSNIFRIGTVTSVSAADETARVALTDRDNMESYNLRIIVRNTLTNKDYWLPDINEQVLCCFLPIGMEQGFILGGFYTSQNPRPSSSEDVRITTFGDGTTVEYDRSSHVMEVTIPETGQLNLTVNGPVNVTASGKATVAAPQIDLGESGLEPVVLGDQLAAWITDTLKQWLDTHTHSSGGAGVPSAPFTEGSGASGGGVYSSKNKTQ